LGSISTVELGSAAIDGLAWGAGDSSTSGGPHRVRAAAGLDRWRRCRHRCPGRRRFPDPAGHLRGRWAGLLAELAVGTLDEPAVDARQRQGQHQLDTEKGTCRPVEPLQNGLRRLLVAAEHRQRHRRHRAGGALGGGVQLLDQLVGADHRGLVGAAQDGQAIRRRGDEIGQVRIDRRPDDPRPHGRAQSLDGLAQRRGAGPGGQQVARRSHELQVRHVGFKAKQRRRSGLAGNGVGIRPEPQVGPHGQVADQCQLDGHGR
jgi:hypothetical protein